jgi:uncharacterized protein (DUF302 family)
MSPQAMKVGSGKTIDGPFDATLERVVEKLADEGFGVLSRIDVSGTLKKKLGVDHPRTEILGACNPACAHEALTAAPEVSLMLPCNVVVRDAGEGRTRVDLINAESMAVFFPGVEGVARRVAERLGRVLAAI